jgi:heme exporter protein A
MSALHVQNLAVVRGDRTVVEAVSFTVEEGEILHIRGRNGAGKTSLLEVLCGLRRPGTGRIEGQPEAPQRHWIGHKNALNPVLSPRENLRFWCALGESAAGGVDAALEQVGLKAQRHRPCGSLSTGQRRRAALARLLAVPRPWWFLDEPLAGLDHAGIALLTRLLDGHARGGGSAVVSSHQPLPEQLTGVRILELHP